MATTWTSRMRVSPAPFLYLKKKKKPSHLSVAFTLTRPPPSALLPAGDDVSGSGSGMCGGRHCYGGRNGFAFAPDNNQIRGGGGGAPAGRPAHLLLLLAPLAALLPLLLQR